MSSKKKNSEQKTKTLLVSTVAVMAVIAVVVIVISIVITINKNGDFGESNDEIETTQQSTSQEQKPTADNFLDAVDTSDSKNVEITMSDGQKFIITVLPKVAPETAANFLALVESGFYNGLTFHRIIDGFMAQGGDPEGTGMGGSDKNIKGEFKSNGFENNLSHQRSVVSMARSQDPDSASSQFFICYDDASFLDGDYAAFGYVSEGMEVVDTFLSAGTDANDRPLKEVKIQTAKIME